MARRRNNLKSTSGKLQNPVAHLSWVSWQSAFSLLFMHPHTPKVCQLGWVIPAIQIALIVVHQIGTVMLEHAMDHWMLLQVAWGPKKE